jgi:hypothetical protein
MQKWQARQRTGLTARSTGLEQQRSAIIFYSNAFFSAGLFGDVAENQ